MKQICSQIIWFITPGFLAPLGVPHRSQPSVPQPFTGRLCSLLRCGLQHLSYRPGEQRDYCSPFPVLLSYPPQISL